MKKEINELSCNKNKDYPTLDFSFLMRDPLKRNNNSVLCYIQRNIGQTLDSSFLASLFSSSAVGPVDSSSSSKEFSFASSSELQMAESQLRVMTSTISRNFSTFVNSSGASKRTTHTFLHKINLLVSFHVSVLASTGNIHKDMPSWLLLSDKGCEQSE
ncbi:unnamed protein product [Haemonchus placei]|uniref:Ovule protein n=1 Tax=Haemonchus placei TaxID=6290 RepID=A0A0N4WSP8_HAEPC|nr:unnamed protein product [Haemonchus placei]